MCKRRAAFFLFCEKHSQWDVASEDRSKAGAGWWAFGGGVWASNEEKNVRSVGGFWRNHLKSHGQNRKTQRKEKRERRKRTDCELFPNITSKRGNHVYEKRAESLFKYEKGIASLSFFLPFFFVYTTFFV